jgi:hypothetical protein
VIDDVWRRDVLLTHSWRFWEKYSIIQYADDTLMIMPVFHNQWLQLKDIMNNFSASSGIHVNLHKTSLVLINTDQAHDLSLANFFGCRVESLIYISGSAAGYC